jgi:hypothetical protein
VLQLQTTGANYVNYSVNGAAAYHAISGVNSIVTSYYDFNNHVFRNQGGSQQVLIGNGGATVNYLTLQGSVSTVALPITATGTDANININIAPKGSGNVTTAANVSATGNVTGGNIRTVGAVSATGNVTGNYFIGNGSQLTGVTSSFAPIMFNDVSGQTNGNTAVFALQTNQTAATGISNSKQLQVTVNGALITPYINSWTWPFFTTYYGSYPGFRVTNLGYGLTANSVIIYNAPAIGSQISITQLNNATDSQLRRYPYSATAIALGD